MTDDLVKELRNFPMLEGSKLCGEAADRIEELESALRPFAAITIDGMDAAVSEDKFPILVAVIKNARAALGEKKDG